MAPKAFDVWDREIVEKFWSIHELSDSDSHFKDIPARPLINVGWSGQLDQAMQPRWTQPLFGCFREGWSALPSWLITSGQYRLKGKPSHDNFVANLQGLAEDGLDEVFPNFMSIAEMS